MSDGAKDEIIDVLVAIGFFEPTDIIDDTAIVSNIREWDDFGSAIGVAADDFDFGAAMKAELEYLIDDGVIVGLTDKDIDEIASAPVRGTAGFNSRIVYGNGARIAHHETENPVQLLKLADCGGFSITELPSRSTSSVPTESTTRAPSPTVPAFTALAAIVVLGLLAVVHARRI